LSHKCTTFNVSSSVINFKTSFLRKVTLYPTLREKLSENLFYNRFSPEFLTVPALIVGAPAPGAAVPLIPDGNKWY
jgi:hypothetical protein